jgi:hypothetical protein
MTCRHSDPINNPGCSSYKTPQEQLELAKESIKDLIDKFDLDKDPDNSNFEILDVVSLGQYIALTVKYESCEKCSYEGVKILVYEATLRDVLNWKVIDPHFSSKPPKKNHAPSPIARFPASEDGKKLVLRFLKM